MQKMNKRELVDEMNSRLLCRRYLVANFIDFLLELMSEKLVAGDKIVLAGFGRFEVRQRQPKRVMHPARANILYIPAGKFVKFLPSEKILLYLNKEDE